MKIIYIILIFYLLCGKIENINIIYCGLFRFLGGHGARNFNELNSSERTTNIFGLRAARFCRALVLALALGLAIGFTGASDAAAGDIVVASTMDSVSVFGAGELKVKNQRPSIVGAKC